MPVLCSRRASLLNWWRIERVDPSRRLAGSAGTNRPREGLTASLSGMMLQCSELYVRR